MVKKTGLGRGLDALFSDGSSVPPPATDAVTGTGSTGATGATEVALEDLVPNDLQPRSRFDVGDLAGLAASIKAQGLIQPLLVTPRPEGGYAIVAGERRWRAAAEAGLERVPVFVRESLSRQESLEAALVENLQRSDLNPIEEAEAFDRLHREFGLSHEEIARRVGKSRPSVSNRLRLLGLPEEIRNLLRAGELSAGQARPLLRLPKDKDRIAWARRAVKEGLNARQLEAAARGPVEESQPRSPREPDPDTAAAAEELTKHLQTKVDIQRSARGGRLVLSFHSEDELMRLYDMLMATRGR